MNSIFFLILRRMRAPLIALIVIYAVSVLGMTLVPGIDADGRPIPGMSFFHAFYFVSYTATTIGFGELPLAFSNAQRLWVTVVIYLSVIGWSYSILSLIALLQDQALRRAYLATRFAWRIRHQQEGFYLVCGCGETGSLISKTLDQQGRPVVVIEKDEVRIQEMELEDFRRAPIMLTADAGVLANLLAAGLDHPRCRAVLAVTSDENANLAVAISARLLNPSLPVLARVRSPLVAANLGSFGIRDIVNPFEIFAQRLAQAIAIPQHYRLHSVLVSIPGGPWPPLRTPPAGHWVVCGYGRFGQALLRHLLPIGMRFTVIDPKGDFPPGVEGVQGLGTEAATLLAAGIAGAQGLIAGSDDDVNNLSIAMTARELNPALYIVTRQNLAANGVLFETFRPSFNMVPSRIVALACLAITATPLLPRALSLLATLDEGKAATLTGQLEQLDQGRVPEMWSVCLNISDCGAVYKALMRGERLSLAQLLRDPREREQHLPVLPLLLERDEKLHLLPAPTTSLAAGDRLLFAAAPEARALLELSLGNASALDYVLTGRESSGWLLRQLGLG